MTISSVGSAGSTTDLAALQKQLQTDEKALATDETKKASPAELAAAEQKVETDEQAIATANEAKASTVRSGLDPAVAGSGSAGASTASKSTGNVVDMQA